MASRRPVGMPCGEYVGGTTYCSLLIPCPFHDDMFSPCDVTRVVLARDVLGHVVPALVLVKVDARAKGWVSGVGSAVLVAKTDAFNHPLEKYTLCVYPQWQGSGYTDTLSRKPARWLTVPCIFVRADRWDETWIELVDVQGYIVMDANRQSTEHIDPGQP